MKERGSSMEKMKVVAFVILLAFFPTHLLAHPSRVRLLIHGKVSLTESVGLSGHFIPAPNLLGEVAPLTFLELNWTPVSWLTISPTVGWAFKPDEVIVSLRLNPKYKKLWGWIDMEVRPQSLAGYWFAQVEYQCLDWLHVGVEEESWGNFEEWEGFSHGGGPNILLRFGRFGIDLTVHARDISENGLGAEFFLRAHLFLN